MDDVWCSLDMATDIPSIADPFWSPFADCGGATSIGNANACFGVADLVDIMAPSDEVEGMADMDTSGFFGGGDASLALHSSMSSSLSSQRSLSIDSGGSSGSYYTRDAALPANGRASQYLAPAPPVAHQPLTDNDEEAIMRAMMAVMSSSSASPSSSASASSPPFCRDGTQQAVTVPEPRGGGCHVMVKNSSLAMSPEENIASLSGERGRQQEEQRTAAGNGGQQLYHMMSERKRREKLNDSFQTLRSLLPPCSKKDKTTVLSNAASYLKTLEAQVSELEEKNGKLEKHIPCGGGGGGGARASHKRAKVQISKAAAADEAQQQVVNLTVMVMVECDVVELVLRILECLRWMEQISVLSVDADTYSPQVLLKAIASIKLRVIDVDWNEASFHEAMTKAVNDATASPPLAVTA